MVAAAQDSRWARRLLPVLLLLSGFCGISYEILYARLLGNLLGNQFTINATVLLGFLLGIGLGTLWAWRFVKWLWLIELGIGLYAAALALLFPFLDRLLYETLPWIAESLLATSILSLLLLALPAFLIGCSVPLFAAYLGTLRELRVFALTYGVYNIGAAVTALAMEFVLLRATGLRSATVVVALLNAVVAVGLLVLVRTTPIVPAPRDDRIRFPLRVIVALILASVASAVFQLLAIKLGEFVFGPYNETFALVLATVLFGIAFGSMVAGRTGLTFNGAVLLALVGIVWLLVILPTAVGLYAGAYPTASHSHLLLTLLKLAIVLLLAGLPAIGFGATIPALLGTYRDVARESGQLLFFSSMANAAGFLLMAFVLHRYLDYGPILMLVAALAVVAILVHDMSRGRLRPATLAALLCMAAAGAAWWLVWDEALLYAGHTTFRSPERLRQHREMDFEAERFKDQQDVFAITFRDDVPYLFINGYVSIPLGGELATEEVVGALSSMFAPRLDRALVLGFGSGATAGTVGQVFEATDVVEINAVILENLDLLGSYNFDIQKRPNVTIHHDDGIHFIRTTAGRYSMILNTVTSPLYFSSSKLYTRDFFEHVKQRLEPDGIYVTWVDGTIGDSGIDMILQTLAGSFDHCWLNWLTTEYYFLVCSTEPLALTQFDAVVANRRLDRFFGRDYALPLRYLPYGVLSTDALALRSTQDAPLNTIDLPVLEYEMARLREPDEGWLERFKRRVRTQLDLDVVGAAVRRNAPWSLAEFALYADLRAISGWTLDEIFQEAERKSGLDLAAFDAAAREYADTVGTAAAALAAAEALVDRERCEAAGALLDLALERKPALIDDESYREAREACRQGL